MAEARHPRQIRESDDVRHQSPHARLRVALALYREGRNADSPFYRFLAYWNAIDCAHDGDNAAVDAFLRTAATRGHWRNYLGATDLTEHLRDSSRNAIAHVIRRRATLVHLDADLPVVIASTLHLKLQFAISYLAKKPAQSCTKLGDFVARIAQEELDPHPQITSHQATVFTAQAQLIGTVLRC